MIVSTRFDSTFWDNQKLFHPKFKVKMVPTYFTIEYQSTLIFCTLHPYNDDAADAGKHQKVDHCLEGFMISGDPSDAEEY